MENSKQKNTVYSSAAYPTLILLVVLTFVNGFVKEFYSWAEPLAEAMVLLFFPMLLFLTKTILGGTAAKHNRMTAVLFLVIALADALLTIQFSYINGYFLVEHRQLKNTACTFFVAILFFLEAILLLMKNHLHRKPVADA